MRKGNIVPIVAIVFAVIGLALAGWMFSIPKNQVEKKANSNITINQNTNTVSNVNSNTSQEVVTNSNAPVNATPQTSPSTTVEENTSSLGTIPRTIDENNTGGGDSNTNSPLANAYLPSSISSGVMSAPYETIFENVGFKRTGTSGVVLYAYYAPDQGTITPATQPTNPGTTTPLYVEITGNQGVSLPLLAARTVTLVSNLGTHTLCIPETQVTLAGKKYYYDTNGSPYSDSGLTQVVACDSTSVKTAYRPSVVTSGTISSAYPSIYENVGFKRMGTSGITLYAYYAPDQGTIMPVAQPTNPGTTTPLYVEITGNQGVPLPLLPTRTAMLVSNLGTHTLCIPETQTTVTGTKYYYDTTGAPYSDVMLAHSVGCSH